MKNKKSKLLKIGLVIFLLIGVFGTVFADEAEPEISNMTDAQMKLTIDSPINWTSYLEPLPFQKSYINIRVLNQFNYPIYDAIVHIYELEQKQVFVWRGFTDKNGIANWPIPNVDHDTTYIIKAEKFVNRKYRECTIYLTVRNRYLKFFLSTNIVDEGKEFFGIVRDQDDLPIFMAIVKFNAETRFTNNYGITSAFKAPWVNKDTTFEIETTAEFRGYDENHSTITVINRADPESIKIYGQVRNYDFQPIKNVKISVVKGSYSYDVYTDENGDYFLWITPKEGGEIVTIFATYSGYSIKSEIRMLDSFNAKPIHINFWLNY